VIAKALGEQPENQPEVEDSFADEEFKSAIGSE
jgi:hypothetical protein